MTTLNQARDALVKNIKARLLDTNLVKVFDALGVNSGDTPDRFLVLDTDERGETDLETLAGYLRVAIRTSDRRQTSIGRPGQRRFEITGSVFFLAYAKIKISAFPPAGGWTSFWTAYGQNRAEIPTPEFVSDLMAQEIFAAFEGPGDGIVLGKLIPDPPLIPQETEKGRRLPVVVRTLRFREAGIETGWYKTIIEMPFQYDQYA